MRNRLVLLVTLAVLSACSTASLSSKPGVSHIVVVGTTDVHGWVSGHDEKLPNGEYLRSGGLDILGAYVRNLREENTNDVLLVDSGDMFQGTLESNLFEGESVVRAYNTLGYAAAAVGNHEFDFGPVGPASSVRNPGEDPVGALKRNASLATFPLLSCNIFEKTTGQRPGWLKPWTIVEVGGKKIGLVGATTTYTPVVTLPANVRDLEFRSPAPEVIRAAGEARRAGADAVVLLIHAGGACSDVTNPNDLSSCRRDTEIFDVMNALPPGTVNVVFAGHTHSLMRQIVNGTPVLQAAAMGRGISVVDLWIDNRRKESPRVDVELRPLAQLCSAVFAGTERCVAQTGDEGRRIVAAKFAGRDIQPDLKVAAVLAPFEDRVAQKKAEPLGITITAPFTSSYSRESSLGDLIADTMRSSVPGADFAVVNSGGLRADLNETHVTFGSMFAVLPFDNTRAVLRLKGSQFREMMRLGTLGKQGILQVSGARIVVDRTRPESERVVSITLPDGSPLQDDKEYVVVASDFLATGGDGLLPLTSTFSPDRVTIESDARVRDIVIAELQKKSADGALTPRTDGRLKFVE